MKELKYSVIGEDESSFSIRMPIIKNIKQYVVNKINIDNFKKVKGVYLLFDKHKDLIYVGKSKNIQSRISSHLKWNMANKFDIYEGKNLPDGVISFFSVIKIKETKFQLMVEDFYIKKYNPIANGDCSKKVITYLEKENLYDAQKYQEAMKFEEERDKIELNNKILWMENESRKGRKRSLEIEKKLQLEIKRLLDMELIIEEKMMLLKEKSRFDFLFKEEYQRG